MTEMMTNRMRMMTVVTMCLLFASLTHIGLGQHVFDINHVNSRGVPIRNLAYDKEGDTLFVGANSTILALDGNLTVKQVFQNYSIQNENLVLKVIGDDTLSYLLSCGTYIGVCEQRNLENISNVEDMIRFTASSTVSNNEVRVVSFTNDGKEKYILFYVRTYSEFDTISYYPINTLQLKNMKIDTEARDRVGLRMINNEKGKYSIEFKAVLESDSFVYFLSQQNESSKLSKQCKSDYTQTNLYEDIYISCKHGEQTFRYIQDGVMLELGPGQFVLVALFTDSAEVDQSTIGALCVFTENEIQESFLRSRKDRLQCPKNELPYSIFQFDELPKMCVNLSDVDIPSIYIALVKNLTVCDPKLNDVKVIVGLIEMTRTTNVTLEKGPEKMAARWANGLHTVYVGTFVGVVNQYYIYMDSENHGTRKFVFVNSIPLNGNKKPVTDIKVFDDSVFVATEDKVFRLPDKICEKYNSCLACMSTESINCGWCILEQKCTEANVDQCKLFDKENQWLPSVKGQCLEMRHTNSLYPFSEENSVAKQTQLKIQFFPEISSRDVAIQCKFKDSAENVAYEDGHCKLKLPNTGTNNAIMELEIYAKELVAGDRSDAGYLKIASHDFFLYKCQSYRSCYDCHQDQRTNCNWDYQTAKCGINGFVRDLVKCPYIIGEEIKKVHENQAVNLTYIGLYIFSMFQYKCTIGELTVNAVVSDTNDTLTCQNVILQGPSRTLTVEFHQIVGADETSIYAMKNRSLSTAEIEVEGWWKDWSILFILQYIEPNWKKWWKKYIDDVTGDA